MNYNNIPAIKLKEEYEATGKEFVIKDGRVSDEEVSENARKD